jgi:hypothetical protein
MKKASIYKKTLNFIIFAPIGIYVVVDSSTIASVPYQRLQYGLIAIFYSVWAVRNTLTIGVDRKTVRSIIAILFVNCMFAIPVLWQKYVYPNYIIGDFASILLPSMLYVVILTSNDMSEAPSRDQPWAAIVIMLLIAAMTGSLLKEHDARGQPPTMLLIALVWVLLLNKTEGQSNKNWIYSAGLVLLTGFLALFSEQRTAIIIFSICGLLSFGVYGRKSAIRTVVLFLAPLLLIGLVVYSVELDSSVLPFETGRISRLEDIHSDESAMARIDEAKDAFRHLWQNANIGSVLIGFGHGATYEPYYSYIDVNFTPQRTVHNIHVGPILILYRYGLAGVVLVFIVPLVVAWRRRKMHTGVQRALVLAVFLYYGEFAARNVLIDPLFSYALAAFFAFYRKRST